MPEDKTKSTKAAKNRKGTHESSGMSKTEADELLKASDQAASVSSTGLEETQGLGPEDVAKREDAAELPLEEKIGKFGEENSFLKDQLLRKAADFENFRKRMFREKDEGIKYANTALLLDVITIIDDFERAIQSAAESKDFDSFHTGVAMIEKRLVTNLEKNWGLKRFESVEDEFDPERHQAIAMEESDEYDKSMVLEDYQKGYFLHDRVIRPAKVKISKPVSLEKNQVNENNDSGKEKE